MRHRFEWLVVVRDRFQDHPVNFSKGKGHYRALLRMWRPATRFKSGVPRAVPTGSNAANCSAGCEFLPGQKEHLALQVMGIVLPAHDSVKNPGQTSNVLIQHPASLSPPVEFARAELGGSGLERIGAGAFNSRCARRSKPHQNLQSLQSSGRMPRTKG